MRYSRAGKMFGLLLGMSLLTAQGAYAASSASMPEEAKSPCTIKLVSAHEGDETVADGDTIPSQVSAFKEGSNAADSDLWVTKDGYIIQMHANDVSITTNGTGLVTNLTLNQILALRTKKFHDPIPTLDDSLALPLAHEPGRYVMFETKYSFASHANLDMLANEINAAGMTDHVIIYSAYPNQLAYLQQIDPGLTVWFKAGAIPPVQQVEGFDGVMLDAAQMTAANVAEFHAVGLTVIRQRAGESPAKWQAFLATGADGLMTDHEATVIKWCKALG